MRGIHPTRSPDFPPSAEFPRFWKYSPDRKLAWNEYGDPCGFPVIYYHGWPSSRLQAGLAHHLAKERRLRLIAMDRPGIGQSTWEPARRLDSWPDLMGRFADSLGIGKFAQLAVSGGGPYVLACAASIPDRIASSAVLAGAVLIPGLSTRDMHPLYRLMMPFRRLPGGIFSGLFRTASLASRWSPERPPVSWLLRTVDAGDRRLLADPEIWRVMTGSFREGVSGGGGQGVMTDANIYFQNPDFDPRGISHPIRYWHGEDDRNIPVEMVRRFTGKIPGATLVVEKGLGHFSLALRFAPAALDYLAEDVQTSGG